MMKKAFALLVVVLIMALLAACGPEERPVESTSPNVVTAVCVKPESDNANSWSYNSCVDVSTQAYLVTVRVADGAVNHTKTKASGSGSGFVSGDSGYASSSYRMWQEGKGIIPVQVISIEPEFRNIVSGDYILLKTSDLKAMALPSGSTTQFVCNQDVEVASPIVNNQLLTTDRVTYELDDCRMVSPRFTPSETE